MIIPYKIKQIENAFNKFNQPWDKKFKCNFCNKEFADISGRRRHEKNNHIEKKPLLLELPWEHGITYCVTRDGNIAPTGPIGSTSTCANLGPHSYIAWDFDTPNNSQEKILAAESGVITLANFAPGSGGFSPSGIW